MHRLVHMLAATLFALCGCVAVNPPVELPPLPSDVSEVRVVSKVGCSLPNVGTGDLCSSISDPSRIAEVVAFVNARPNGWSTPFAGAPIHPVHVQFYRDGRFIDAFGVSPSSFERNNFLSQRASHEDVDEALRLAGLNRTHLRFRTDDPIPQ